MKLATPYKNVRKNEDVINVFGGLNITENYQQNEFSHMKNISHRKYPAIVPRESREQVDKLTTQSNGILSFKNKMYIVDGTSFKEENLHKGTVTNGKKCLIEFNQNILIFPDLKYYDTVSGTFGSFANGTDTQANPLIEKATVHNNRVFGIKGANIYASKQGDFKEWNVFAQLATDSWATDVAGAVDFKTIGTYQNHVVIQSDINMFELYGYKPSNFQVQETVKIGSNVFSYVEINSVLYFANRDGIYAYAGGVPRKVSAKYDVPIIEAELGSDGRRLFASVSDGTERKLLVYDTELETIAIEDGLHVVGFTMHNGSLHALSSDLGIYKFGSGFQQIQWELETVKLVDDYFSKSGIRKIEINAEMGLGSAISVFIKGDTDVDWTLVKSFLAESEKMLSLPVILNKNCYKIKITGRGYVKLNAIKRSVTRGGRL